MTTATISKAGLPETLDIGSGSTHDRGAAIAATRHQLEAVKALFGVSSLEGPPDVTLRAVNQVAHLLGGSGWTDIAWRLVMEVVVADSKATAA
jgi:hypothetical protein